MAVARVALTLMLSAVAACAGPDRPAIRTLVPGVLKIAVTSTTVTDPLDPEEWMYRYAERLAKDLGLRAEWHVVPVDKSSTLAGEDVVDVVARALADHPDAVSVTEAEHRQTTLVELYMAPGDLGRVIGRQGRTAQALRTLVGVVAEHDGKRAQLEFRDAQPAR